MVKVPQLMFLQPALLQVRSVQFLFREIDDRWCCFKEKDGKWTHTQTHTYWIGVVMAAAGLYGNQQNTVKETTLWT